MGKKETVNAWAGFIRQLAKGTSEQQSLAIIVARHAKAIIDSMPDDSVAPPSVKPKSRLAREASAFRKTFFEKAAPPEYDDSEWGRVAEGLREAERSENTWTLVGFICSLFLLGFLLWLTETLGLLAWLLICLIVAVHLSSRKVKAAADRKAAIWKEWNVLRERKRDSEL